MVKSTIAIIFIFLCLSAYSQSDNIQNENEDKNAEIAIKLKDEADSLDQLGLLDSALKLYDSVVVYNPYFDLALYKTALIRFVLNRETDRACNIIKYCEELNSDTLYPASEGLPEVIHRFYLICEYLDTATIVEDIVQMAEACARNELYVEAIMLYSNLANRNYKLANTFYNISVSYFLIGLINKEVEFLEKSLTENPNHNGSLRNLGQYYFDIGDIEKGTEYYKLSAKNGNTVCQDWCNEKNIKY